MKKISYLFITIRLAILDTKIKLSKNKIIKYRKKMSYICEKYHIPYFSEDAAEELAKSMSMVIDNMFPKFKDREN